MSRMRTRSISKLAKEKEEDIKPDEMELNYRKIHSRSSYYSQESTFKSKTDRTVNGEVFGIESDVKFNVKKEPNSGKTSVCICQINLNLKKP